MNRLTEKIAGKYYSKRTILDVAPIIDKLGALEDVEERLGVDLITLFKALKDGIYKKKNGVIYFSNCPIYSLVHKTIDNCLIEDYGRTWALTKEELK